MRVVTAPEDYMPREDDVLVFLAGGIMNCPDWQSIVIEKLSRRKDTDNLVIFNPRRANFPIHDPNAAREQIEWEFDWLEKCDIFSMYFSSGESDQPICMYELGRNLVRMKEKFPLDWENRVIVSVEEGYRRSQDVQIQIDLACDYGDYEIFNCYNFPSYYTVSEHADMIYRAYLIHKS